MRYLKEEPFLDIEGKPLTIRAKEVNGAAQIVEETRGSLFKLILAGYQPTQEFHLSPEEQRLLNRVIDTFEKQPAQEGHFAVEDADWGVMQRVVNHAAPMLVGKLTRLSPVIVDMVKDMPKELPSATKAKADAALIAEAAKQTMNGAAAKPELSVVK